MKSSTLIAIAICVYINALAELPPCSPEILPSVRLQLLTHPPQPDTTDAPLVAYSKFDFIPGERIIAIEDFAETSVGDFPAKWFTNGTGEVVTFNKLPGKWLKMSNTMRTSFIPEYLKKLPENFTVEFDFVYQMDQSKNMYTHFLSCVLTTVSKMDERVNSEIVGSTGMSLTMAGGASYHYDYKIEQILGNTYGSVNATKKPNLFTNANAGKVFHVSLWRQGTRMRVYLDGEKIFDLPRIFKDKEDLNQIRFFTSLNGPNDAYYISNLRVAAGAADTRNKLVTEGKLVTRGILFASDSDVIRGESYGVLKEIAHTLNEHPEIKVQVVGHTDSDGDDKANLALSKKRAEAVKQALVKEFTIETSRITTDGMGESQAVDNNTSKEGKANNRRVEFIKF